MFAWLFNFEQKTKYMNFFFFRKKHVLLRRTKKTTCIWNGEGKSRMLVWPRPSFSSCHQANNSARVNVNKPNTCSITLVYSLTIPAPHTYHLCGHFLHLCHIFLPFKSSLSDSTESPQYWATYTQPRPDEKMEVLIQTYCISTVKSVCSICL